MKPSIVCTTSLAVLALGLAACARDRPPTTERAHASNVGREASACGRAQVFFASGEAQLDVSARQRLDRYRDCLAENEIDTIYVAGVADPATNDENRLTLGRARACAIAEYLRAAGCTVPFEVRWRGETASREAPLWPPRPTPVAAH